MALPVIKISILGASSSGKTMFMHGMYATLSMGGRGYFLGTANPNDDLRLTRQWELLRRQGKVPEPTQVNQEQSFEFVLNKGFDPLVRLDYVDFRGGVLDGMDDEAEDVAKIQQRLLSTDSIYLIIDGVQVASWIRTIGDEPDADVTISRAYDPMLIGRLGRFLGDAVRSRRQAGRLAPSAVLLVTKADLLEELTGMKRGEALRILLRRLESMFPALFFDGLTTLVCPVQLGNLGLNGPTVGQAVKLDPVGLSVPFMFSLYYYLTETLANDRTKLDEFNAARGAGAEQLAALRRTFGGGLFAGSRIARAQKDIADSELRIQEAAQAISRNDGLLTDLTEQLRGYPIIKDGKLLV
jgi:hypothetical protein